MFDEIQRFESAIGNFQDLPFIAHSVLTSNGFRRA